MFISTQLLSGCVYYNDEAKAISANINGKVSKLSTILKTGDVVEIKVPSGVIHFEIISVS